MGEASIEHTLNQMAAPPFASNNPVLPGVTKQQQMEANEYRETQKDLYHLSRGTKATKKQPIDAPWRPDPTKRGVSPSRRVSA